MANPTAYTTLMAQLGKTQANSLRHAEDAKTHSQRHVEAKDAERASKTRVELPRNVDRNTGR